MKKILVTGASGFIGRHCLPKLAKMGYEVHALSSKKRSDDRSYWHLCDLYCSESMEAIIKEIKPTHLLHLAWYAEPGKFWASSLNLKWVNISLDLAQYFVRYGGRRFVAAGTCAEYDWSEGILNEQKTVLAPNTLYGTAKNALRSILSSYFKQEQVNFCWGRIFYPYGPYEHSLRLIPYVIRSLLKKQPANCTEGKQIRDLIYVEDLADLFVRLVDHSFEGEINLGSGQSISIREVCEKIAEKIDAKEYLKMGAIKTPQHDAQTVVADASFLSQVLQQWQPRTSLEEGLIKSINWWKNESNN